MVLADIIPKPQKAANTKNVLRWAALFLGELRDGLTMVRDSMRDPCDIHTITDLTFLFSVLLDQHAKCFLDRRERIH
jgi:hypothetical protein